MSFRRLPRTGLLDRKKKQNKTYYKYHLAHILRMPAIKYVDVELTMLVRGFRAGIHA